MDRVVVRCLGDTSLHAPRSRFALLPRIWWGKHGINFSPQLIHHVILYIDALSYFCSLLMYHLKLVRV